MNRVIKFRAIDEVMGDFVYGIPTQDFDIKNRTYIVFGYSGGLDKAIVIAKTIGQFTGFKDKIKQEVYEGDILEDKEGRLFVVVWLDNVSQIKLRAINGDKGWYRIHELSAFRNLSQLIIIGNIHENPGLIK